MANANVDQNWLRGVLAIAQNNPAGHLQTQPYAPNSNQGNVKFIHDGRMYFKHRVLRAASISAMCDQQSNGCKGRAWFRRDGTFIKIITQHGCEANPSNILSTAVQRREAPCQNDDYGNGQHHQVQHYVQLRSGEFSYAASFDPHLR